MDIMVFKDLKDHSRLVLTGDLQKDIETLEHFFSDRKAWIRIVDCTIAAKQANVH